MTQILLNFIVAHWGVITFGALYTLVAVVGTMPAPSDPRPFTAKMYQWFYDFLHLMTNKAVEKNPKLAAADPNWPK